MLFRLETCSFSFNLNLVFVRALRRYVESSVLVAAELERMGARVQVGFQRRFDAAFVAVRAAACELEPLQSVTITSRDPAPPPPDYMVGRCKLDPSLKVTCFQPLNLRVHTVLST